PSRDVKLVNNPRFTDHLAPAAEPLDPAAARHVDQQAVATILTSGSGRSYAAEVVAGGGFNLDGLAAVAGQLLAKDVGILADHTGLAERQLLAAADAALARMGVARQAPGERRP